MQPTSNAQELKHAQMETEAQGMAGHRQLPSATADNNLVAADREKELDDRARDLDSREVCYSEPCSYLKLCRAKL